MNGPLPLPRAPKYIADIARIVGAVDHTVLEGAPIRISASNLPYLTNLLEAKSRRLPVVAISDDDLSEEPACLPQKVADFHCGIAHVLYLDPGASWALTNLWGPEWSTYRGALRCYMPGMNHQSDEPHDHRLWFGNTIRRLDAAHADGFLNQCLRQVFAAVTAQFESFPLLSPAAVLRRAAEDTAAQMAALAIESLKEVEQNRQILPEPVWTDEIPLEPPVVPISHEILEDRERAKRLEQELNEKIDILTAQLKAAEDQLQEARNQNAQERVKFENLKDELELYKQVNEELQLRVDVLTGKGPEGAPEVVRGMWTSFSGFFEKIQNLAAQYRRVELEGTDRVLLGQELDDAKSEIYSLRAQNEALKIHKAEVAIERAQLRVF